MSNFIGVDYGSKLAGTTVIAFFLDGKVRFNQSQKKKDADKFLEGFVQEYQPKQIFLDAPLSLPGVYQNLPNFNDYFYRQGDKALKAMSPMFLGGLTARAMRLAAVFRSKGIQVFETYPAIHAQELNLKSLNYKKQLQHLPKIVEFLTKTLPFAFDTEAVTSWHTVDALLAYYSGYRYQEKECQVFGEGAEGQIWV